MSITGRLLDSQRPRDLMYATMILLGVKLFLRFDEICNIRMEDFLENATDLDATGMVKNIYVKIQVSRKFYLCNFFHASMCLSKHRV
jgi:integrase